MMQCGIVENCIKQSNCDLEKSMIDYKIGNNRVAGGWPLLTKERRWCA